MGDVYEIYHRSARSGNLQRLIARCDETEQYFHTRTVHRPPWNPESSQMETGYHPPFKCHTTETIPISLFQQCLSYIAYHAHNIDSLDGFPVDVANMIFTRCIAMNKLDSGANIKERQTILSTFCHAFALEMLHSCKITNLLLLNNFEEEFGLLFRGVSKLDLSNCLLGDSHDLIRLLPESAQRLEVLILSGNNLSNRGLRDLLLPRYQPKSSLQYLDISQNPDITMLGITKYVAPFESIKRIVISNVGSNLVESLQDNFKPIETFQSEAISNEGWSKPVIDSWVVFIQTQSSTKKQTSESFYGKKKVPSLATTSPSVNDDLSAFKVLLERKEKISPVPKRPRLELQPDEDNEFDSLFNLYRS